MAKKVILKDLDNVEILPITRGELIVDSSGKEAFHSNEFLATNSLPGLMSPEEKVKISTIAGNTIDSTLSTTSVNPVQNKVVTGAINEAKQLANDALETANDASENVSKVQQILNSIKESYLKSATVDGNVLTIVDLSDSEITFTNTTYNTFLKETAASTGGRNGLVPKPNYNDGSKTRFLREDGTWVIPTNSNTTYTFANGTSGNFTVTPSGGTAQTVSIGKPATAGTADVAVKLQTKRKLWGLDFDGTTDVSGNMTGVGNITITSGGNVDRFITFDTASTRSWRIGYLGSGSGDANYLAFQSTKTLTATDGWHDMLKIGCETGNAILTGLLTAKNFVSGDGINDFTAGTVKLDVLNIPTSSGGTTFGPGSNGQILKSNGTTVYWASDNNSDTWRPVMVNGTSVATSATGTGTLNIVLGTGITVSGAVNSLTITNAGVISVTIGTDTNSNKVAVNTNGTTNYLTIPYATKSKQDIDGNDFKTTYLRKVSVANNTTNDFNTFENMTLTGRGDPATGASLSNAPWSGTGPAGGYGVLTYLWSGYGTQMAWGYHSNKIYIRNKYYTNSAATWSSTWDSLALTSEVDALKNYYWADQKISSNANAKTTPTFATATVTTSVQTPLILNTSGILTLNGKTNIYLKINNTDSLAINLAATYLKPFGSAKNLITLGTSDARWKCVYSNTGNFTSNVESITTTSDAVKHAVTNTNGSVELLVHTNRGLYDRTNSKWIIYVPNGTSKVYVPTWASKGGSTTPVYFNASGEPVACTAYSGLLTALSSTSTTNLSITVGGTTKTITELYANITNYLRVNNAATARDANTPVAPIMVHYGSTGSSIANMPSGWNYGGVLTLDVGYSSTYQTTKSLLFAWDIAHNTTKGGSLWFRGSDSVNKWAKSWCKVLTSDNYTSYLGYIGTTAVQTSAAAQALTGITRISNSANNILYLGNSDNSSWVYTLDICSHSGTSKWAININGLAWFSKLMVGIAYNGTGSNYAVNVSGDSHVTGWSRAGNGFYVEGKGVHYMSNNANGLGQIYLTSNEFNWSASTSSLYFNYRASANGTTVTLYIWNAGSSSSYASHTLGNLTTRGTIFVNTGDPTLKIYSGKITDAKSDGNICFLTCIDGLDGLSHSYAVDYLARNNIVLQPRGGQVYIGTNPDGGNTGYKLYVNGKIFSTGFVKSGSSDSYVLLGGGGHKAESSLSVNYATSAGNADTVDSLHASAFMRAVSANGYYGMGEPGGGTSNWIRTTVNGIIPYLSGGASNLGTSSWPFSTVYANNFYGYLNGNISGSAASAGYTTRLYANSTSNLTTNPGDYSLAYSRFLSGVSNIFPVSNNANGVITAHLHSGDYYAQIGLSSNGRMYYRTMMALTLSAGVSWNAIAFTSDIPTVTNYYWANVKVSASSNAATYPTFANMKSTGRVYLDEWIQFSGSSGLYWPNANGAHLYANTTTSYAGLITQGARNGYCGLHCGPNTNYMTVMSTDTHHGLYCETYGWEFYFNRSNGGVGIRTSSITKNFNVNGQSYLSSNTWIGTTSGGEMLNVGGWVGTVGNTGWYSITHAGGWFMLDTTYVRTYNSKAVYVSNTGDHAIYTAGGFASARTNGSVFATYYNGTWYCDTLFTHGNGNLSISPPGGSLYLSYNRGNTYFGGGTYYINRSGYFNGTAAAANSVAWANVTGKPTIPTVYSRNIGVNGTNWTFYSSTSAATTSIYAPTSAGTSGYILQSSGGTPTWTARQDYSNPGILWVGYIYRSSRSSTSYYASKSGGKATFSLTSTPNSSYEYLSGTLSGHTSIMAAFVLTQAVFSDSTTTCYAYSSINFGKGLEAGFDTYRVSILGSTIYIRACRMTDANNSSWEDDGFLATGSGHDSDARPVARIYLMIIGY